MGMFHLSAFGQTDGYNPSNPPNPEQAKGKYMLEIVSSPKGACSANITKAMFEPGSEQWISASNYSNFELIAWIDDKGDTISNSLSFYYTMPERNAKLTMHVRYNPANPGNPEASTAKYTLSLKSKPEGACYFSTNEDNEVMAGEQFNLNSYANNSIYKFQYWEDAEGNVISTDTYLPFTMPANDVTLYAVYKYSPDSPDNPNSNEWESSSGQVIVDDFRPGELQSAIDDAIGGYSNSGNVSHIIVSGKVSNYDMSLLSYGGNYPNCTVFDLSRVSGVTQVTSWCFSDNTKLSHILLPSQIGEIGYYAFGNCTSLKELTCYALVPPTVNSDAFEGVPEGLTVYVPSASLQLYQDAEVWKDFTIMPITADVLSLGLYLPENCSDGRYKNMTIELVNVKNGQRYKYVITDRISYVFSNLPKKTLYNAYVKNQAGIELARLDSIAMEDKNVEFTFENILTIQDVELKVLSPDGADVTSSVGIAWADDKGEHLGRGSVLYGMVEGQKLSYSVSLPQELAMECVLPQDSTHTVVLSGNTIQMQLLALPKTTLKGRVKNPKTGLVLVGANVSVLQVINGQYTKTFMAQSDKKGLYEMDLYANMPTTVTISAEEHVSVTSELTADTLLAPSFQMEEVALKPIIGVTINTQFTYTPSVQEGTTAQTENWYEGYANVAYTLYNKTADKPVTKFNVQFPKIVLLEEVAEGSELIVTATSKLDAFNTVADTCVVDENQNATVTLPIVQQGGVALSFGSTENAGVTAMLYDGAGKFVRKYKYSSALLQINDLKDGEYTIVSMGESTLFNSIYNLSGFAETGLVDGTDFVTNKVKVQSGVVSTVKNVLIPFFDESKLYYTGQKTVFTVNKSSIVAGNYLTFQANVDFKEAFRNDISEMEVVFELPEGNSFVENSMIIGSQIAVYEKENNTVSVKVASNQVERLRFCVRPIAQGKYSPNAYVKFSINGEQVSQPIGNVNYEVKNHFINLPSIICREDVKVSGNAPSRSEIVVYDGQQIIGKTQSMGNGQWRADCKLIQPYNMSTHKIYAKILTKDGLEMQTETKECVYDINAVEVSKVTMFNISHRVSGYTEEKTVFDFLNPATSIPAYWYWPSYPEFTFLIDFTNNDTTLVSNVVLYVETCKGNQVPLEASFDARKGKWIASGNFGSWVDYDIPTNVSIDFDCNTEVTVETELIEESLNKYAANQDEFLKDVQQLDTLLAMCDEERAKEDLDFTELNNLELQIFDFLNRTQTQVAQNVNDSTVEALLARCDEHLSDSVNYLSDNFLKTLQSDLNKYLKGMTFATAEDIDTAQLVAAGYEKLQKTDGSVLFFYVSETEGFKLIDKSLNVAYTIDISVASPSLSRSLSAARSVDFAERMNIYAEALNEYFDRLRTYIQTFADLVDNVSSKLIKANELLGDDLAEIDASLKYLRANNGSKYLITMLEAKFDILAKKVSANDKIITWIESNFPDERWKIGRVGGGLFAAFDLIVVQQNMISDLDAVAKLYNTIPDPCPSDPAGAENLKQVVAGIGFGAGMYYVSQIVSDLVAINSAITGVTAAVPSAGASLSGVIVSVGLVGANMIASELYSANFQKGIDKVSAQIANLKCTIDQGKPDRGDGENERGGEHKSNNPNVEGVHDPSGYVYEGISSNRLQGVTATCYYKRFDENMYGEKIPVVEVWNASEYQQENPLLTDDNGMYRWDVPEGLWQVKFEKEGYQTTYSEWLPVPPPQLEVNVGMVQNVNPEVKSVKAYEDGVEIEFTKYMKPESMTSDKLYLKLIKDGKEEYLTDLVIKCLNAEQVSNEDPTYYASKVALTTETDLATVDEVYVIVAQSVESYVGRTMSAEYNQKLDVERKIRSIKVDTLMNIGYGQEQTFTIGVLPAEASKGKTLVIKSVSSSIATLNSSNVRNARANASNEISLILDKNGETQFTVIGDLKGTTALTYSIKDADISYQSMVNVVDTIKLAQVKDVVPSRISGSELYRGQTVALSCETEGATIYYTLDGSCPCDPASRIKYEGRPIVVNDTVTITAMAVGLNGSESESKVFEYTIKQTSLELALEEGWNWTSHNQAADLSASSLEKDNVSRILSQTGEVINDPVFGFVGNLGMLSAHQSIKVETKGEESIELFGEMYNPSSSTITLHKGWNWLGYPLSQEMFLDEAFALLEAEEGDVISTLNGGFSAFENGKWDGTLKTLTPGEGYLYKSVSEKRFIYNDAIVSKAKSLYGHRLNVDKAPWSVNVHEYPNMMCITADLFVNGEKAEPETFHVGAFADGQCRGVGKYVSGVLYLSVYGKGNEKIRFIAQDKDTEQFYEINDTLEFKPDVVGNARKPHGLNIGEDFASDETESVDEPSTIYNLHGQKLDAVTKEGIYIINGKKVIMNNKNRNEKY